MGSNKKRRTGLQEIANLIGISKMTVSRYLRDPNLVSKPLQSQISAAIDQLGYIPNKAPDMLSNAKSYAIGVLLPSLTNQVFADVLKGIEIETDKYGYQTMIAHTGYSPEKEEMRLRSLLAYNVDGLILTERTHTPATLKMIEISGVPVVEIMDSVSPCIDMAVGIDNFQVAKNMIERMINKGHKHIAYFSARQDDRSLIRQQGYEQAMNDAGLVAKTFATKQSSSYSLGKQLLHQALQQYPQIDGVFSTNDDLALGVLFECQRLNIDVPNQIAVAGFHGHDVGQVVTPKLASVSTPRIEMGQKSAQMLLKSINGETICEKVVDFPVQYLDGESI
ncbi:MULTISPECIES: gluconate operon transcriptional repressor GntR [unclassified Gilliamella]|uniref:gluconate operon transcriptional repressor GntR n=1 Tax=unclassified Gilliamella TaxID=2685620 RepID=UPI001C69D2B2|nr:MULTISPECIES: gluconate operon transcriptional repressor GntR [unclassified Gilliamella]MCX8602127.1 gluconate operon transcriptional repressor GntR [Gilliamella sp. B3722]MCX8611399.1 gluconate operon transcriptional repressor GntR [Gilliamella sp. B3891]MCX8613770.1 gluconate operon transcriptional repressor GntR [Gilliamella sp. B3773]MCX8615145.1 gluconate operon transcriptional repressor GntR [Gilliamella sp. B3770]MCX8618967.1 gluconate operon transcriptional repressor GntR [Gilliamel